MNGLETERNVTMGGHLRLTRRETELKFELAELVGRPHLFIGSMPRTRGLLSSLLPAADHIALCISKLGCIGEYLWFTDLPSQFAVNYPSALAPVDFVLKSVTSQPRRVLRDSDMLSRPQLRSSALYSRCRQLGMPIEHVMAVRLEAEQNGIGHGGLTLYRSDPRSFTERDRALGQDLTGLLSNAIDNYLVFEEMKARNELQETVIQEKQVEFIAFSPDLSVKLPSPGCGNVFRRWFKTEAADALGVPAVLLKRLEDKQVNPWVIREDENFRSLKVTFVQLTQREGWVVLFEEFSHFVSFPEDSWRDQSKLTPTELQVVRYVVRMWDTRTIADELNITSNTVKQHLKNLSRKLGTDTQKKLIALALRSWR